MTSRVASSGAPCLSAPATVSLEVVVALSLEAIGAADGPLALLALRDQLQDGAREAATEPKRMGKDAREGWIPPVLGDRHIVSLVVFSCWW